MQLEISSRDIEDKLREKRLYLILKRSFDIVFSIIGLIFLMPICIFLALSIKIDSKGPTLFKQKRVGLYGKEFYIYKFRTMVQGAGKMGMQITVDKDTRVTRIGKVIRKYKLDELPQLINVIKGDMSIVGPRPEVIKYVDLYDDVQRLVLLVRPGITDYASIRFKDEGSILGDSSDPEKTYIDNIMPYKIQMSLKYIEEMSFINDVKLILSTIINILIR